MAKHGSNWQGVKIQNEKMNTEDKQAERHVDGQTKGQTDRQMDKDATIWYLRILSPEKPSCQ